MSNILNSSQCYSNSGLFLGGLNASEAQTEAQANNGSSISEGTSGYCFSSNAMSGSICVTSCLKYGFVYAAVKPR